MKKIFSIVLILVSLIGLNSCFNEVEDNLDKYEVTFILDYNNTSHKVFVNKGELVNKPNEPTRDGFIFNDWFYNGSSYDFNTPVTKNIVLYGEWKKTNEVEKITYEITFILEYNNETNIIEVEAGKGVSKPEDPVREGYLFTGWFYNGEKYHFITAVTKNMVLYGQFRKDNSSGNLVGDIDIDLYYINDLHGSLTKKEDQIGLDYMANVILTEQEDKDVLFITGGDILQGQLESNDFKGESIIETLNHMNLDAFVIGNHEFDWGLETVLAYFNGEHQIQANYPLLGANVFLKETDQLPNGITPYTIVNKNGLDVLIIGVIGYGLESSIDGGLVKDYYFADPIPIIDKYIKQFKEDVDVIVVAIHGDDNKFNTNAESFGADVILNGHTHRNYVRYINEVPVLQTGSSGRYLGKVEITHNVESGTNFAKAYNLTPQDDKRLYEQKEEVAIIVDYYYDQIKHKYDSILISDNYYSVNDLAYYIAKVMREKTNSDIAFHNSGGTRTNLSKDQEISEATILEIFPFDNFIITVDLKGLEINKFISSGLGSINDKRPGITFNDNEIYKVAVHSYTFNFEDNPFMYGDNIKNTNIVLREAITEVLKSQKSKGYIYFNVNNPITFDIEPELFKDNKNYLFLS